MPEKEFCLLYEPWIRVIKPGGGTEEVSLLELFQRASEFQGLAGELPTQDTAVLRLLLAILHAVFGRYDLDGEFAPISSPGTALKRWKDLWERGSFPMKITEDYLLHYEDRFWLFHPERPFYQLAGLDKATDYTAAKLNGELSESNNKIRLFPQRTGSGKDALCYAEAARWLLYVNSFDDTSAKPKRKGLPSPGAGWLGQLGLITAVGKNLFETLLLNLVFLKDGANELWGEEEPVWEAEEVKSEERTRITMPDNPSGLLTLQSRRLLLKREEGSVIGYALLGGDFFPKENAFAEQMTVWRTAAKKKDSPPEYHPRRHDPARQLWRDFPTLVSQGKGTRRPGVIGWLARLKRENLISRSHFHFQTTAVKYGDKDFFIDDVFGDSLSFNAGLLTTLGDSWITRIIDEIDNTDKLVEQVGLLAKNLARAAGDEKGSSQSNTAKEQAYFRLDGPFRWWLEEIDPATYDDKKDEVCDEWWERAQRIVSGLGTELVEQSGPQTFAGRNGYSAPKAYNYFKYKISTRKALKGEAKHG